MSSNLTASASSTMESSTCSGFLDRRDLPQQLRPQRRIPRAAPVILAPVTFAPVTSVALIDLIQTPAFRRRKMHGTSIQNFHLKSA